MQYFLYFSNLLYSRQGSLDRMSFLQALLALVLTSLILLLLAYAIGININPNNFLEFIPTLSYNALILITSLHAILVFLNITKKRIAYLRCNDFYILWVFIPFVKILFLGLLLIDLPPNNT